MRNGFFKGHGLGNDYVAVDPAELEFRLTPARIRELCDRNRGVGSDGLLALCSSRRADFGVRIFNPDGSEAERSGNGLRIFARFLYTTRRTRQTAFRVETRAGVVGIRLILDQYGDASSVAVEMGPASFRPDRLPCSLRGAELVDRPIRVAGRTLQFTGVSVGNPHCVLFRDRGASWSVAEVRELGPRLENHRIFPNRCNVQFAVPTGRQSLFIRIWERGAGETAASGTSACAVACAAVRRGIAASPVTIRSPGGALLVRVGGRDTDPFDLTLEGPAAEVMRGKLSPAFVRGLAPRGSTPRGAR
ncbi:MAG: diaminopimelate epimerase [Myxococcota bacterium]